MAHNVYFGCVRKRIIAFLDESERILNCTVMLNPESAGWTAQIIQHEVDHFNGVLI